MTLHLREADVEALIAPSDAIAVVEACLLRVAAGSVDCPPGGRVALETGSLTAASTADPELGFGSVTALLSARGDGSAGAVVLVGSDRPELLALVEAGRLSALRAAATSAVAARLLSRPGTRALGLIGCGRLATAHVECLRVALPGLDRVVAYCRTPSRLSAFCERTGAEPAEYGRDAAEQEIVVTATSSRDPVLRGDWLRPGACVLATGATRREDRELDNAVLARASFVCCDSLGQARLEAGDLAEPVERGVLDWLEVHALAGVVGGAVQPRGRDDDVMLYKSSGAALADASLAALVLERALAS
ncbi:MAG: hypothetical protein KJ051_01790 [Thermoleophilia bacterium]|nr:hypothetical protein [Thermoleophilia bacterium]